jgi:hypothetical protein
MIPVAHAIRPTCINTDRCCFLELALHTPPRLTKGSRAERGETCGEQRQCYRGVCGGAPRRRSRLERGRA